MNINHEDKYLIFPEAIACTALSAPPPLVSDITIAVNQIMAAPTTHSDGIFPLRLTYAPTVLPIDTIAHNGTAYGSEE